MDDTDVLMPGEAAYFEQQAANDAPRTPPEPSTAIPSAVHSDPADAEGATNRQQRTVPYGALAEERARRKELQRDLQTAMEAQQRLQGRLDLLHELAQQRGTAPETDDAASRQDQASDAGPTAALQAEASGVEAQADAVFRTQLMLSVRDFAHDQPDFLDAYQHARQARVSELLALGYAPQEALGITFDNELEVIRNAYANGRNPAQVIYDYARQRGYGAPPAHGQSIGDGGHRPAMTEAEKVALAARGQATSKSLSTAAGGSTGALTLEALASMSDEEFAEATKGDRWQKLLKA